MRSRPLSSSISTPSSAASTSTSTRRSRRTDANEPALARAYTQRRGQHDQQPEERRDHRSARARSGRVPRRLSLLDDPGAARARGGPLPDQPRDLVRADAPARRSRPTRARRSWRWTAGSPRSRTTAAASRSSRRSPTTGRPTSTTDARSIDGVEQVALPGVGPVCQLAAVQTQFATPATAAGEGITTDQQRCQLKPLRQSDYYPITFTPDQWAALQQTFPTGVCDWSKPGVDQVGHYPLADLSGRRQRRCGDLRRQAARSGAGEIRRGLDEQRLLRLATVGRAARTGITLR